MGLPELSIGCRSQEVPDVPGRMEDGHQLEVEQRHLCLILAEHHVVGPGAWESHDLQKSIYVSIQ